MCRPGFMLFLLKISLMFSQIREYIREIPSIDSVSKRAFDK